MLSFGGSLFYLYILYSVKGMYLDFNRVVIIWFVLFFVKLDYFS